MGQPPLNHVDIQDYFSLPSLKEYLIIDQDQALVTLFRRHGDGDLFGMVSVEGPDAVIELKSIEAELSLAKIYADVTFPKAKWEG